MEEQDFRFFEALVLKGLTVLQGERTPQSLYYMVKGRKANQVWQDVNNFNLHSYYRLFPWISRGLWEQIIQNLMEKKWVSNTNTAQKDGISSFELTHLGNQQLCEQNKTYQLERWLSGINGMSITEQAMLFRLQALLMVQTISQLLHDNSHFSPIVQNKEIQRRIKQLLAEPDERAAWLNGLVDELYLFMDMLEPTLQQQFFLQWTGASQVGLTARQIAYQFRESFLLTEVKLLSIWSSLYCEVKENKSGRFPLLQKLCLLQPAQKPPISISAWETYNMLQKDMTLEEIASRRTIKLNTVEDHLIEAALKGLPCKYGRFVSDQQIQFVHEASDRLQTKRLRLLKDELGHDYSYLQIRLALALRGASAWKQI
ncbi:helix-turn-helix domain-containing protein [Brevibacillus laterosporus]|uniref:helix-turn-helix domain-containing protein n=1 Tax=Brevibacillus laterosporus TaxID=1465 RepID=UPI000839D269|nr:helix-turn-helix domain-containing protein [Brevibacillus laterosporus]